MKICFLWAVLFLLGCESNEVVPVADATLGDRGVDVPSRDTVETGFDGGVSLDARLGLDTRQ